MNKKLIVSGIGTVAIAKVILLMSVLNYAPAYEQCISGQGLNVGPGANVPLGDCGTDPFSYIIIGWVVVIGGFTMIILGLRMPAIRRISR